MAEDSIEINIGKIKKYFLKNNFVFIFSLFTFFSLIFFLSNIFSFSLGTKILIQINNLFSSTLWFFLLVSFILGAILAYHEKYTLMFVPLMIWLIITTAIVRTSNMSGLVNVVTGEPSLGPDLDPYLYLRHAIEISEGRLREIDYFRQAPLGVKSYAYSNMMPWAIFLIYKISNIFTEYSITQAAIIAPVIFFLLSIIGFFLFVYVLFSFKLSKNQALTGAAIASFLYAFVPSMLHRTIAGVPEIESLGMVWFWLAFLFFALAWKQNFIASTGIKNSILNNKKIIFYGLLAGLFTGAMSWTWGGYRYIYMVIALSTFLGFLFNIEKRKNLVIFSSFLIIGLFLELLRMKSFFSIINNFADSGFAFGVFLIMFLDFIFFGTKLKNLKILIRIKEKIKLPENVFSFIIFIIFGLVLISLLKPSFISYFFSRIVGGLLAPFGTGRVGLTVAENKAPYLVESLANFGSIIWVFLIGLILIFYDATKHFSSEKKLLLNFFFILFVMTLMFSRFSPSSMFNGENFISKFIYFGGLILFAIILFSVYIKAFRINDEKTVEDFSKMNISSLILISFAFWAIISMRGAVRLFFIIAPMVIIISSFFFVWVVGYRKIRDDLGKMFVWVIIIVSLFLFTSVFVSYASATISTAKQEIPSPYNQQWQYAMDWVSKNTPEDSIFVHWWDYGYWVQTIGKRPTVTDGGHANEWWDHTTARYLLTTSKPETALSLLKTHNVSYLLIDSTDVGKYSAFSSIGSDKTGKDRFSWIPVMPMDPSQTREANNKTRVIFVGGQAVDKDIVYIRDNGSRVFLPSERAGLAGVILEYSTQKEQKGISFSQPTGVFVYNNQRYDLPLRYLYFQGEILDFGSGVNSMIRIIPGLQQSSRGLSINPTGAIIYLSEKTKDTLFSQLYLLDDPEKRYPTITLAHVEDDFIIKNLKQKGLYVGDFLYFQGLRGPIKIWDTRNIPENIIKREEFLWFISPRDNWAALDSLQFTK